MQYNLKKVIPIKIAHISDIHQGSNYSGPSPLSRFEDINRILDWSADKLIAEKVDLCLIAGDCFKDAKVMLDRASQEIASMVRFLRKLEDAGIGIIVISGTPSHDAIPAYELMEEMLEGTIIETKPEFVTWGDICMNEIEIACLPGLNRSALLTQEEYKGLPPEQVHRIMTDKITQLCQGMSAQMRSTEPKILMAHMTYQGADTGFSDLLMQHEPILTREAVAGFDLVCLGHIHRPQQIDGKVFYSGPIERLSFNDEDIVPGFWIYDVSMVKKTLTEDNYVACMDGQIGHFKNAPFYFTPQIESRFIETPARRYVTLDWGEGSLNNYIDGEYISENLKDAIVRLHYSCSEETAKQINRKQLEQSLYDAGAFYVTKIKADIERTGRARDNTVNESLGPVDALAKWCANQGIDEMETQELVSMASGLMEG